MYLILAISKLRKNTVFIIPQSSRGIYMSEETRLTYSDKETDGVMIDLSKIAEQTPTPNINLALKFLPFWKLTFSLIVFLFAITSGFYSTVQRSLPSSLITKLRQDL